MTARSRPVSPPEQPPRGLDDIDRQLLRLLQRNGRATNQSLAEKVALTPTPCLERVRRLEREGYIRQYQAVVAPDKVGYPMLIFASVLFDRADDDVYVRFREGVSKIDEIVECHMITGNTDFLIKIRVPNIEAFRTLLEERLLKLPGVRITHSSVVMEDMKQGVSSPIADA